LGATIKQGVLGRAATVCDVDELTHDIPQNRIVKTILHRVGMAEELPPTLRGEARALYQELEGVQGTVDVPRTKRLVQLHRNNRFYSFLLDVCDLIYDQTFILEGNTGTVRFRNFVRDEGAMRMLFQRFVHNFLKREQDHFNVGSPKVKWAQLEGTPENLQFLPEMRTDIALSSAERLVIIDTKFTASAFQARYEKKKVQSDHLYQLHTYVQHVAAAMPDRTVEGILLYPVTTAPFSVVFSTLGHKLTVRSIDLRQDWKSIRTELLNLAA
jgi:5-methylcytosine-specific restriction enzyme subunit McrC